MGFQTETFGIQFDYSGEVVASGTGSHSDSGSGSWGTIMDYTVTDEDVASGRVFFLTSLTTTNFSNYGTGFGTYGIEYRERILHTDSSGNTKQVHQYQTYDTPSTSTNTSYFDPGDWVSSVYVSGPFVAGDNLKLEIWMDAFYGSGGSGTADNKYVLVRQDALNGSASKIGGGTINEADL